MPPTPVARALIGLDERGMVMALHLEDAGEAVADINDAGVLAGALDDPGRRGRQFAQVNPARIYRKQCSFHIARDDAELGEARRAADERDEARIFLGLQPMAGDKRVGDFGFGRAQA